VVLGAQNLDALMVDLKKSRGVVAIHVRGQRYVLDPEHAFPLYGWNPRYRRSWWSTWVDVSPTNTAACFWAEGQPMPLDRTQDTEPYLTPDEYRSFVRSPLLKRYRAKRFGPGAPWMLIAIIMIALMAFLAILYFGGYYG
jgi:hypothetical protein